MPGVLIVEALAQAGAVGVLFMPEHKGKLPALTTNTVNLSVAASDPIEPTEPSNKPVIGKDKDGNPIYGYDADGKPIIGWGSSGNPIYGIAQSAQTGDMPISALPFVVLLVLLLLLVAVVYRRATRSS